jgi:WD40 repeat protein
MVTHQLQQSFGGALGPVGRVAYLRVDKQLRLIGAPWDGPFLVWDPATGSCQKVKHNHGLSVFALSVSRDGRYVASGAGKQDPSQHPPAGGELSLLDLKSNATRPLEGVKEGVADVAFNPDGSRLAVASFNEVACIWDVIKGEPVLRLDHPRMAVSVAYSPDGHRLATGSFDGVVTIWDSKSGHKLLTLTAHTGPVVSLSFSPDGACLASAGGDGKVKMWDTRSPHGGAR